MTIRQWTIAAGASLVLSACGGSGRAPAPPQTASPNDFTALVSEQVTMAPADATPVSTDSLTNLNLDNPQAFSAVMFAGGDTLAAGVYSATAACLNAGTSACDPGLH